MQMVSAFLCALALVLVSSPAFAQMTEFQGDEIISRLDTMKGLADNLQITVSWCFLALVVIVVFTILTATRRGG